MIIVMCCTKSWYHYLEVSLYSLLSTNKIKEIYLFLEDDLPKNILYLKNFFNTKIEVFNYKEIIDKYISKNNTNKFTYYSDATLVRLFISKILQVDKVIYLDTDAIVLDYISELWQTNLKGNYIAGVKDKNMDNFIDYIDIMGLPDDCINAGVIVMNLKKIRNDKIDDKFLNILEKKQFKFPDQDIINLVCKNHILFLPNKFNSSLVTDFAKNIKILHFAYKKTNWIENFPYSEIWYEWEKNYESFLNVKSL